MFIIDSNGREVYRHTETQAGYCAFGGGTPDCNQWVFDQNDNRWPDSDGRRGESIRNDDYTLEAIAFTDDGRQSDPVDEVVTIRLAEAPAPQPSNPTGDTTGAQTANAVVTAARLNVRSGPGTNYEVITMLAKGDTHAAIARNATSQWILIELDPANRGWVSALFISLDTPISDLPVATP